jgi:hypothetical protein
LYFGDRVAVLNDFIYQTGGSTTFFIKKKRGVQQPNFRRTPEIQRYKAHHQLEAYTTQHKTKTLRQ